MMTEDRTRVAEGETVKVTVGESDVFIHVTPACDHDFRGWREIDGGRGGERYCSKCGIGAMAWSLRTGI